MAAPNKQLTEAVLVAAAPRHLRSARCRTAAGTWVMARPAAGKTLWFSPASTDS